MTDLEEHRRTRSDAERNHARLMVAAAGVFAEQGLDASVDDIARRAGLGKATIFRQFGDKERLIAAIACDRLNGMADQGEKLTLQADAGAALRKFMMACVERLVSDRFLCQAMGGLSVLGPEVLEAKGRMIGAVDTLLRRAQEQDAVRADLVTPDVMLLVAAISQAAAPLSGSAPRMWKRYFDIVFDGLRPGAATPISHGPPTVAQLKAAFGKCPWESKRQV